LLHDIGKVWELSWGTSIDYTTIGRLQGHIVMGVEFFKDRAANIDDLSQDLITQVAHLILSHQGSYENGCPVVPMTREAFILYYLDEIDSKMNAIDRELEKASNSSGEFTGYINLLDRMLYKGPSQAE
ncbi:HD domain-containing protein, partial [bacterium]|nr:HD domain-containing protein [bacterium]